MKTRRPPVRNARPVMSRPHLSHQPVPDVVEVVQDTLVRLAREDHGGEPAYWLYGIAQHALMTVLADLQAPRETQRWHEIHDAAGRLFSVCPPTGDRCDEIIAARERGA